MLFGMRLGVGGRKKGEKHEGLTGWRHRDAQLPPSRFKSTHSPWLQIRRFGDRLVETEFAHKPVRVLSTLALKIKEGETWADQREEWRSFRSTRNWETLHL